MSWDRSHRREGERPSLLSHCLQGSSSGQLPQRPWGLGDPLPSPLRECTLVHSTKHSPSIFHSTWICLTGSSCFRPHGTWAISPIQMVTPLPQPDCIPSSIRSHPEWPPQLKRRDEKPLHRTCGWWEAFARDSELLQETREEHYKTNHPHFNHKTSHNLTSICQNMITSTSLLGSQIYEIQESWEWWSVLQYANDTLRASPKGLQFFCAISPSELPKVMGLAGIHNPDALCHFNGMTFCPWCRKKDKMRGLQLITSRWPITIWG